MRNNSYYTASRSVTECSVDLASWQQNGSEAGSTVEIPPMGCGDHRLGDTDAAARYWALLERFAMPGPLRHGSVAVRREWCVSRVLL
jgi:hypothetical protein